MWRRLLFRLRMQGSRQRRDADLEQELRFHLDEETADQIASGSHPERARSAAQRSLGNTGLIQEDTRATWTLLWLEHLLSDLRYSSRQLLKNRLTSAAAVLSLALAIGSCTAAFRLIDALFLRPLPVAGAERLHVLRRQSIGKDGAPRSHYGCEYPLFTLLSNAVAGRADLFAMSFTDPIDITFGSDSEMEKAIHQYVSGNVFSGFGIQPALGRLFTEDDNKVPRAFHYVVLSYDYWTRRFDRNQQIVGRSMRYGNDIFQIIGVAERKFTGTEPGVMVDIFLPTMMHSAVTHDDSSWFRTLVRPLPGVDRESLQQQMQATVSAFQAQRAKSFHDLPQELINRFLAEKTFLDRATSGASTLQKNYGLALSALAVLVALVLLIACANVANLLTARSLARSREMALRISIGAGRGRLIQLVLAESAWISCTAAILGWLFASWAAPLVVSWINPRGQPVRLDLSSDWRNIAFGFVLAAAVTILFGLSPAIRASAIAVSEIRKPRLMHGLISVQVAFCVVVIFVGGLFIATYDRLANIYPGFHSDRILVLHTIAKQKQPTMFWNQVADHLRTIPGVEKVALSDHALLDGSSWGGVVSINGAPPTDLQMRMRAISPGWLDLMGIRLLDGRDFRPEENSGVAIVNERFAKAYFKGDNPIGRTFARSPKDPPIRIIGLVTDTLYSDLRNPAPPLAFVPFNQQTIAAFIVRTQVADPLSLAPTLRRAITEARSDFRVTFAATQRELLENDTVRERLLAVLALFFAAVSLCLAGVGLFGVLDYSVLQRRREIGIRLAIGAPVLSVLRVITASIVKSILLGSVLGVLLGVAAARWIQSLLYGVEATDGQTLAIAIAAIFFGSLVAASGPAIRAIRLDPVRTLRQD